MEELKITVDLDGLTIGDLEMFETWQSGSMKVSEMLTLLDRIVQTNKPIRELPLGKMREIINAIKDALGELQNPKN